MSAKIHLASGKWLAPALLVLAALPAHAVEYPIGTPHQRAGMEIAAVYLQPVTMEPDGMMSKAEESDIHIEADIKALANNPNGFEEGAWMPYLVVKYEVSKSGGRRRRSAATSCPWWPTTARTTATTSSSSGRASTTSSSPSTAVGEPARALRPPHRPADRRAALVQALRGGLRLRLRRHRQKRRLLSMARTSIQPPGGPAAAVLRRAAGGAGLGRSPRRTSCCSSCCKQMNRPAGPARAAQP